ncbi:MAG: ubiquinol-cytochrome C chaperone family protein [Sphingopyxis sp.]|nr:ubiquinol-cytochrome C chaperone family protein [Sphingopyxis sp.]
MSIFQRLFSRQSDPRDAYRPAYDAIVTAGRDAKWYLAGAPDTINGRFEMIAAILAHVLLRLERIGGYDQESVWLTEWFIDDMDGQLRQIGIGDLVVGKHVGQMMSALGGRLAAYRNAAGAPAALRDVLVRNVWSQDDPGAAADAVTAHLADWAQQLDATDPGDILAGRLPRV